MIKILKNIFDKKMDKINEKVIEIQSSKNNRNNNMICIGLLFINFLSIINQAIKTKIELRNK